MRISDWSSDVCSSDLQQHDLVIRLHLLEGAREDVGGIIEIAAEQLLVGPHHPGRRVGETFAVGILANPLDQGRRSEEHTSELQSLMRISYAVFCLKKKQ